MIDDPGFPDAKVPNGVTRTEVVQGILDLFENPNYLEIGVFEGKTFNNLKAGSKSAVDPAFAFDYQAVAAEDKSAQFFKVTSDRYFAEHAPQDSKFDVVYIDGLHTFEQTLRDLLNAFSYTHERSVIVIDDVYPSSYIAGLPDKRQFVQARELSGLKSRDWMGDVYKLIYFIETFCQQYDYRTINNNHGQLVLWRARRKDVRERTIAELAHLGYEKLFLEKDSLRLGSYASILETIKAVRSA
ncbi:class I SAM-dependent methyltransferase [uncultured Methylobacterium sp.]|jgi:hypothetical protein|uniref:class I SAM-dependent methyltransferase n=1 Tax=uncultured Methylobacterium sp. TaxID=157278 RepID=UPI00261F4DC9|nr:class I SAM-dependent methyltransferase [uncultured Methylobacterium sp.]